MEKEKILEFYKQTSQFTDLGYYKDFAKNLPDDIEKMCIRDRFQLQQELFHNHYTNILVLDLCKCIPFCTYLQIHLFVLLQSLYLV